MLYVGRSAKSLNGRVGAMYATTLGDAKPHPGGHWLKVLSALRDLRIWWAETDAHEEYEDALIAEVTGRNDGRLPFANLIGSDAKSKVHGLEHSLAAEGSTVGVTAPSAAKKPRKATTTVRKPATPRLKGAAAKPLEPTRLTAEGLVRLTAELDTLRTTVRPDVIARVKAARELGDLKENGDYEYARKEQSFVEGRIQALENLLRHGVVADDAPTQNGAQLGSTITVETEGDRLTFTLVNTAEANAAAGRISNVSPVGLALMGARPGDEITVQLPVGDVLYRVIEIA